MKNLEINGDRIIAFLIVDGKVYSSDCDHQDCLEMFYADKGVKSEFDYTKTGSDYDEEHNRAVKKTYEMKEHHEAYGFDLFETSDGYFLLGHDQKTLFDNIDWAKQYQMENKDWDIKLGYFMTGWEARVLDEKEAA